MLYICVCKNAHIRVYPVWCVCILRKGAYNHREEKRITDHQHNTTQM